MGQKLLFVYNPRKDNEVSIACTFVLYNQGWVGITCAGIPLYSSSFVYCVCLSYLSVES